MSPPTTDDTLPGPVSAAVVVAHPDDEILWCGGFILSNPDWHWRIVTLCRAVDVQRLTFDAYMNKKLVRARPLAHLRIMAKNIGHLTRLIPAT